MNMKEDGNAYTCTLGENLAVREDFLFLLKIVVKVGANCHGFANTPKSNESGNSESILPNYLNLYERNLILDFFSGHT